MKNSERVISRKMIGYCDDIADLLKRFGESYEVYVLDKYFQYACNMCIIQIGELANRLTDECKDRHTEIPWKAIRSMRNIHAHDYEHVELDVVWKTLTEDIPRLREKLSKMLDNEQTEQQDTL